MNHLFERWFEVFIIRLNLASRLVASIVEFYYFLIWLAVAPEDAEQVHALNGEEQLSRLRSSGSLASKIGAEVSQQLDQDGVRVEDLP